MQNREVIPPSPRFLDVPTFLFLLAALIFLYSLLFIPPFLPIDHNIDGLTYVADGKRMIEGQVMYRDFFQFSTPGTALIYFFLFKLLGIRLWIPDLALLVLGGGTGRDRFGYRPESDASQPRAAGDRYLSGGDL